MGPWSNDSVFWYRTMGMVAAREELRFAKDPKEAIFFFTVVEIERRFSDEKDDIIPGSDFSKALVDDFAVLTPDAIPVNRIFTDLRPRHHCKPRDGKVVGRKFYPARRIKGARLAFQHTGNVLVVPEAVH